MAAKVIFHGTDHILELLGVKNKVTGEYINGGTAQVTLYQLDGVTEITGTSWPLTMPYVTDSDGDYRVTLPETIDTESLAGGIAIITFDGGAGLKSRWKCALKFSDRPCCPC